MFLSVSVMYYVSNIVICLYLPILIRERLAVHKARTTPFDMDQFRMLFCTCKVPGITKDTILNFFKTGQAYTHACLYAYMCLCVTCVITVCCRERRTLPLSHDSDVSWEGIHI